MDVEQHLLSEVNLKQIHTCNFPTVTQTPLTIFVNFLQDKQHVNIQKPVTVIFKIDQSSHLVSGKEPAFL